MTSEARDYTKILAKYVNMQMCFNKTTYELTIDREPPYKTAYRKFPVSLINNHVARNELCI